MKRLPQYAAVLVLIAAVLISLRRPTGVEYISLGGVRQAVIIKGSGPVLLFLHGGPGLASSGIADWFKPLEEHFTVVLWDQRGSGLSRTKDRVSTEQILSDTIELSEILNRRFGGKIILVGHSWGSYIGTLAASKRPDLYVAYVGVGQWVDGLGDRVSRRSRVRFLGKTAGYGIVDYWNYGAGFLYSANHMKPLSIVGVHPAVPAYYFEGRDDHVCLPSRVVEYAGADNIVWFENSQHWPFLDEPVKFVSEMRKIAH